MLDTSHFLRARSEYIVKLNEEKVKMKKASDEKRETDRITHYGNVRYLEGKIDLIDMIFRLYE